MAKAKTSTKTRAKPAKRPAKKLAASSTIRRVKDKTVKLASSPAIAEVVATTLVAAAAALRDPRKARRLAEAAADEIGNASKQMTDRGGALWQLALDVARRSVDAMGGDEPRAKAKKSPRKPGKKKTAKKKKK